MRVAWFNVAILGSLCLAACGQVLPSEPEARECQELGRGQRYDCYSNLAKEYEEPGYCDYIIDAGFRVECKQQLAITLCEPKICQSITGDWKQDGCQEMVEKKCER